ncbi:MAG TPA: hypothetical protein PLA88_00940, partial [Bacteroidales bacterium]|nr:hypothetical protein [Bacteroidales bacterium]
MKLICLILFINVIASTAVSQVPEWVWGRGAAGSYGLCFPKAAIADKSGNSYVTGIYDGNNVVFGTTTLYNHGNPGYNSNDDIFLVKYDANGNVVWEKNFGGTFGDHVNSIALDSSGNIFIAGTYFYGPISFGNVSLPANTGQDMFIAKFDNNGNAVWARNAGSNNCYANGIEVNGSGDVFITGGFSSQTITIGSTLLTNSSMGMYDFFVARYNSNGTALWAKSGGGTNHDHLSKLTVDNLGNVYVCGCYNSPVISIGSYSFSHAGGTYPANDIFIAKYSASGNIEWARSIGGTGNDEVNGIEADDFGHFFIAGTFSSDSLIIDTAVLQNTSSQLDILFAG